MNIDNLHDALGLLDDEIIEEVEALRSGRKQSGKNSGVTKLFRWGRLVACLGLFLVGAVTISFLWSNGFGNTKTSSVKGDAAADEEIVGDTDGTADDVHDLYTSENTSMGAETDKKQKYEVKVEITSVQENCFVGIVKESTATKQYAVGTELTIMSSNQIDFSEGSVVVVRFTEQTNTETDEIVICADSITADDVE